MPLIPAAASFDPDSFSSAVIGIAAELADHDSFSHQHQRSQLLFAPQGCMTITLDNQWLILPPTRAAWIPGNINHRVQLRGQVAYRSLYFNEDITGQLPITAGILTVNPLLRELIERVAFWPFEQDIAREENRDLIRLLCHELAAAKQENTRLTLPTDRRLKPFIAQLDGQDGLPGLSQLALALNLHSKTLTRIFIRQTGLSYQQWSQQWRLMRAIELLAESQRVSEVAQRLSFSSDSAFIAFFRQYTATTPKRFMAANGA